MLGGVSKKGELQVWDDLTYFGTNGLLIAIVPFFVVLLLCFLMLELDWWFAKHFSIVLKIERETGDLINKLRARYEDSSRKRDD